MTRDLEASSQLFGAYLHQDWVDEFGSDVAAVQAMIDSEPRETLFRASKELRELLSANLRNTALQGIMTDTVGCYFDPASKGQTYHDWLSDVLVRLECCVGEEV